MPGCRLPYRCAPTTDYISTFTKQPWKTILQCSLKQTPGSFLSGPSASAGRGLSGAPNLYVGAGTGAVVPWQGDLWAVTYSPHEPFGSDDKLYQITPSLEEIVRPESVGGTHADRMIHDESGQLFIGPYAIDADKNVRALSLEKYPGRYTGVSRHLEDPGNRVLLATMEAGFYDVDVHSLDQSGNARQIAGLSR